MQIYVMFKKLDFYRAIPMYLIPRSHVPKRRTSKFVKRIWVCLSRHCVDLLGFCRTIPTCLVPNQKRTIVI